MNKSSCFVSFSGIRAAAWAALTCLVLVAVSCRTIKTVTVEVPVEVHDTTYVSQQIHDSVYVENTEYIKGDTVYKTKLKYVEKIKTDTVVKYVEKPVEVVKETFTTEYVEKENPWWKKTLMYLGALLSVFVLAYVFVLLNKKKR